MSVRYNAKLFFGTPIPQDLADLPSTKKVSVIYTGNAWGGESQYFAVFTDSIFQTYESYYAKEIDVNLNTPTPLMTKKILKFLRNYVSAVPEPKWYLALVVS